MGYTPQWGPGPRRAQLEHLEAQGNMGSEPKVPDLSTASLLSFSPFYQLEKTTWNVKLTQSFQWPAN